MLKKYLTFILFTSLCACGSSSTDTTTLTVSGSTTSSLSSSISPAPDSSAATYAGSPSSLNVSVYAFYISTHEDCSSPLLVSDNGATAFTYDLVNSPTLFSASPSAGTYPCFIMKMKDVLSFTPDSTAAAAFPGDCETAQSYGFDIYRTDSGELDSGNLWKDIDGNDITPHGTDASPVADTVYIFASTTPSAVTSGSLGASSHQVLLLSSPLTVPGQSIYYVDFNNGISNGLGGTCGLERGSMGFR